jgi:hypothetical protein
MTNIAHTALSLAMEKLNVAVKWTLSYFQIWTPTVSMKERQKLLKKGAKKMAYAGKYQKVVLPSTPITDPNFGYVNSAQTNVAETFKKFQQKGVNDAGLRTPTNENREQHKEAVGEVFKQKIRRIQ